MVESMTFRAHNPANSMNGRDHFDRAPAICATQGLFTDWMRVVLGSVKTL
jgi:hypothetical protein